MSKARDYKAEYRNYHSKPAQIRNRSMRNSARRLMIKRRGKEAVRNKDVDHRRKLSQGGGNRFSNLRIRSVSANRADNGH